MGASYLESRSGRNRSGSALVGLIVVAILVVVVFSVQWCRKSTAKDPDLCDNLTPWKEWRLREVGEKPPGEPSGDQPDITRPVAFDMTAHLQNEARGEVRLVILPGGTVSGAWSGQYYKKPKIDFDIMNGGFEGRVYPRKIYRDENGQDPSKLYFMANGAFLIAESDFKKNTLHHRGGDIYVRGWLNPDHSMAGKITITSNEKHSEEFDFKASHPVKN